MCVLHRTQTGESEDVPPCVGRMCGPHVVHSSQWVDPGTRVDSGRVARILVRTTGRSTTRAAEQQTRPSFGTSRSVEQMPVKHDEAVARQGTPKDQLHVTMEQRSEACRASEPVDIGRQREDSVERVRRLHRDQVDRFERRAGYEVRAASNNTQRSDWIRHVGWAQHLAGLDRARLRATRDPVRDHEPTL